MIVVGEELSGAGGEMSFRITKINVLEHARDGVRVNAVLPGWIETAMTEAAFRSSVFEEKVLRRVPLRRWGTPAVAGARPGARRLPQPRQSP